MKVRKIKNKTIDSRLKHIYAFSDEQTSNKKLNNLVSFRFFDDLTRNVRISIQSLEKFEENYKHLIPQDIQYKIDNLKQVEELSKKLEETKREFQLFKNKFKNINENDFIDNRSSIELLKKVNIYAKKLSELGVDVNKL